MSSVPKPLSSLGKRYELKDWLSKFELHWRKMHSSYFQFERRQVYQEPHNTSFREFIKGSLKKAMELIEENVAKEEKDLTKFYQKQGNYVRLHTVSLPLTDYLRWEFQVYNTLTRYGQRILIVDITNLPENNEFLETYDFLLLDELIVFVQDYGEEGILKGGWIVKDKEIVNSFVKLSRQLTQAAVPLGVFQRKNFL